MNAKLIYKGSGFCGTDKQQGQALAEYMIAAVFLSIVVWYALVGGGVLATDPDPVVGVILEEKRPQSGAAPGLVQALHKKQDDFAEKIYEP